MAQSHFVCPQDSSSVVVGDVDCTVETELCRCAARALRQRFPRPSSTAVAIDKKAHLRSVLRDVSRLCGAAAATTACRATRPSSTSPRRLTRRATLTTAGIRPPAPPATLGRLVASRCHGMVPLCRLELLLQHLTSRRQCIVEQSADNKKAKAGVILGGAGSRAFSEETEETMCVK